MKGSVEAGSGPAEAERSLYSSVALLVAESRVGGEGGGWERGPHCPALGKAPSEAHRCEAWREDCRAAERLGRLAEGLGRRGLPLSLAVLAEPRGCPRPAACPAAVLLELWKLEALPKATRDARPPLPPHFLLQALASHLHFSQLSAWLTQTNGKLPFRLAHRAILHGEDSDEAPPSLEGFQAHSFPNSSNKTHVIKVELWSRPRSSEAGPPSPKCRCGESLVLPPPPPVPIQLPSSPVFPVSPPPPTSELSLPPAGAGVSSSTGLRVLLAPRRLDPTPEPGILLSSPPCSPPTTPLRPSESLADTPGPSSRDDSPEASDDDAAGPSQEPDLGPVPVAWRKTSFTEGTHPPHRGQRPRNRAFNAVTGLPLHSSPAPLKRNSTSEQKKADEGGGRFDFDPLLRTVKDMRTAALGDEGGDSGSSDSECGASLCRSAPASTSLLGNFEESALRGRLRPSGSLADFRLELAASGAFCPPHLSLPVATSFFATAEDAAPSPYLGCASLPRRYHIPRRGTLQATLFNPQGTVLKMFVVRYDLSAMPPSHTSFLRQRSFLVPREGQGRGEGQGSRGPQSPSESPGDDGEGPLGLGKSRLRYVIHLRLATSRSGKVYLHSEVRMLFCRSADLTTAVSHSDAYVLRSFTEMPHDPKFSPRPPT